MIIVHFKDEEEELKTKLYPADQPLTIRNDFKKHYPDYELIDILSVERYAEWAENYRSDGEMVDLELPAEKLMTDSMDHPIPPTI